MGGGGGYLRHGIRGCAYERSNPDLKIRVHLTVFPNILVQCQSLTQNYGCQILFLNTKITSTIAQKVLNKLRNDFKLS